MLSPDALKPVVGPKGVTLALNWDELLAPNPKENGEELLKEGAVNGDGAGLEAAALELSPHPLVLPGGEKPVNVALNWDELLGSNAGADDEEPSGEDPKVGNDTVVDPAVLKTEAAVPTPLLLADTPTGTEVLKVDPADVVAAAATGTAPPKVTPPDPNVTPPAAFGTAPGRALSHPTHSSLSSAV